MAVTCVHGVLRRYLSPSDISSSGGCEGQKPKGELRETQRQVF